MTVKNYYLPQSLDEALQALAEDGDSMLVMAGGTVVMPLVNEGITTPERVMGLRHAGLNYIRQENGNVVIGATTTLSQLFHDAPIKLLREAAGHTGAWAIRNMGTVGGNLFVPPPAGDVAVALLALDAQLKLIGQDHERMLPLAEFYTGFMMNALQPGELVAEIHVPLPRGQTAYIKYGRRHANTPAVVTVAAHIVRDGSRVEEVRIALNAVGPHPIRATKAEAVLAGSELDEQRIQAAAAAAAQECEPFTDAIASEWYRRKMVEVYVRRALAAQLAGVGTNAGVEG